jgi:hypothetical protein
VRLIAPATMVIALAITATPALGASTRAEYVAQVDPICQSAAKPAAKAARTYFDAVTRIDRAKKPSRAIRNAGIRFLGGLSRIYDGITEQIALIPPAPGDEAASTAWLDGRRIAKTDVDRALAFLRHGKPDKSGRLFKQASQDEAQGTARIQDFGFTVCVGQTVIDWQET